MTKREFVEYLLEILQEYQQYKKYKNDFEIQDFLDWLRSVKGVYR